MHMLEMYKQQEEREQVEWSTREVPPSPEREQGLNDKFITH
jgi:hypothetical protein